MNCGNPGKVTVVGKYSFDAGSGSYNGDTNKDGNGDTKKDGDGNDDRNKDDDGAGNDDKNKDGAGVGGGGGAAKHGKGRKRRRH